jgi:hypothetical protein
MAGFTALGVPLPTLRAVIGGCEMRCCPSKP